MKSENYYLLCMPNKLEVFCRQTDEWTEKGNHRHLSGAEMGMVRKGNGVLGQKSDLLYRLLNRFKVNGGEKG